MIYFLFWVGKIGVDSLTEKEVHEDYAVEEGMILDLFLPHLSLAFQYQGEQYYSTLKIKEPQWNFLLKENQKRNLCDKKGITLIEVPYWWGFEQKSLMATIQCQRPELMLEAGIPIRKEAPRG